MGQLELFEESKQINSDDPIYTHEMEALFEHSVDAFYAAAYARMSGLPIQGKISRFIEKVLKASGSANSKNIEARTAATQAAFDRGDPDVLAVLKIAYKVQVEVHRLTGLLRFSPEQGGEYVARCSPDYFILPALAEHFTLRFGETPWAIIDEKRRLCLRREKGGDARLVPLPPEFSPSTPAARKHPDDSWEDLWRLYHKSINNESRNNPRLQRQFIPERYQKYLTEKI